MAMTAVQALCRIAKTIPDQPNNLSRERRESVDSLGTSVWARFSSPAIFSGTGIECSGVQNLRPICSGYSRLRRAMHRDHWRVLLGSREQNQDLRILTWNSQARIFWRIWRVAARRLGRAREGGPDLRCKCRFDWIRRFQFGRPRLRENGLCRASGASLLLLARAL